MAKAVSIQEKVADMITDLARAVRAASIYPHRHPIRDRILGRLHERILALLSYGGPLEIKISSHGLTLAGDPLVTRDGSAGFIAGELFARQVSSLSILSGITLADMEALAEFIKTSPEDVREEGGCGDFFSLRGARAVRVEEVDYDGILKRREETGRESTRYTEEVGAPVSLSVTEAGRAPVPLVFDDQGAPELTQDQWLETKLAELDRARDLASYKQVLRDIFLNLRATGALNLPEFSEKVVRRMGRHLVDQRPPEITEITRAAVRELATPQVLEIMVGHFVQRETGDRDSILALFETAPEKAIPALLIGLANEKGTFGRKALLNSLARFGEKLRPYLEPWLPDDRWYVVRNAVALLVEVGGAADSGRILPFLGHENPRVRMEALRFFFRHPVPAAEEKLLPMLQDPDPEVLVRAVYTLGARGGKKAFERLSSLAKKPFLGEGDVVLREAAIRGMGRRGGAEAVELLRSLLGRKGFLDPEGHQRIDKAAVEALMEVGGVRAREALAHARPRLAGEAGRMAEDYLRRAEEKEAG